MSGASESVKNVKNNVSSDDASSSDEEFPVENFEEVVKSLSGGMSELGRVMAETMGKKVSKKSSRRRKNGVKSEDNSEESDNDESENASENDSENDSENEDGSDEDGSENEGESDNEEGRDEDDDESDGDDAIYESAQFMAQVTTSLFQTENGETVATLLAGIKHSIDQNSKCILKLTKTIQSYIDDQAAQKAIANEKVRKSSKESK